MLGSVKVLRVAPLWALCLLAPAPAARAAVCSNLLQPRPGVQVPAALSDTLGIIADRYCQARIVSGRRPAPLVLTSSARSAGDEARELQARLRAGDRLSYYENQQAIAEIRRAFARGLPLAPVLEAQTNRGCYVSKHLFGQAVDVGVAAMSRGDRAAFRIAAREAGALVIEDEGGRHDHFHLNFPPYPADPSACPKG